jgi:hypothetical protein
MAITTIFQEELDAHSERGTVPYFIAYQRATDYYRRYTLREVYGFDDETGELRKGLEPTPDVQIMLESSFYDASLSPESRALFNDLVRLLFEKFCKLQKERKISTKYLSYLIRSNNLEHILDLDLQDLVQCSLRGASPMTLYEFAQSCEEEFQGPTTRNDSRITNKFACLVTKIRQNLQRFLDKKI